MRTGALLDAAERQAFKVWFNDRTAQLGLSKKALSRLLRSDDASGDLKLTSTNVANRYLTRGSIPSPAVLVRFAQAIKVPWPLVFLRAGYFREVLGVLDVVSLAYTSEPDASEERRYLVRFALQAFPRRDVTAPLANVADALEFDPFAAELGEVEAPDDFGALTRRLHPLLARAVDALGDTMLPPVSRRAVAGEYVNAWADAYDLSLALEVRSTRRFVETLMRSALPPTENWRS